MTLTNPAASNALADAPFGADDHRTVFAKAVALATAVMGRVGPHQLVNATPCAEYDVRGGLKSSQVDGSFSGSLYSAWTVGACGSEMSIIRVSPMGSRGPGRWPSRTPRRTPRPSRGPRA